MRTLILVLLTVALVVAQELTPSQQANQLFEEAFAEGLKLRPMESSRLGRKQGNDRWDDLSEAADEARLAVTRRYLDRARKLDRNALDPQTRLSYDLFVQQAEDEIADFRFRNHSYPVNQMHGWQGEIPSFLLNVHRIDDLADAQAYVARLRGVRPLMAQLVAQLKAREKLGIMPPRFVFAHCIESCQKFLDQQPNMLLTDFQSKLTQAKITDPALVAEAVKALAESVEPGYRELIACLEDQQTRATDDDGVWKLPDGAEFYAQAVQRITTTRMTPDQIHELGLAEVQRIQREMGEIKQQVGFKGTLPEFFAFLRDSEQFYYPDTEQGRADYMRDAEAIVNAMRARLGDLFLTQPKAPMIVKRVEAFREKSAGKAFYESPAPDGSRPGIYYANLYRTRDMPRYQMEALAYHEGIPGHHMQLSIAQEMQGLPQFRRYGGYTAYIEGWGLYCEKLPGEIGFYKDPYSNFGRLAMELFRACRLVVDTGLHHKRWTRQQAIDYYVSNTPNSREDCVRMVERHVVMPGQATAYKIGMNRILELREKARAALGDKFDLRQFHEVVLTNGALPLTALEALVDDYVKKNR